MTIDIDPLDLVDPTRFAKHGYPHHVWTRLRAEAPVAYIEPPGYPAFWAITKHADVMQLASQPQRFSSASGITLAMEVGALAAPSEMVVFLDPPRHGPMPGARRSSASPLASSIRARPGVTLRNATSSRCSPLPSPSP